MSLAGKIRQGGIFATLVVVLFGTTTSIFAADWPQWRQNVLHTGSTIDAVSIPLTQGWSVEGFYIFPPAIANGIVYLPRSTDPNTPTPGGGLAAYRLADGTLLWQRSDLPVWGSAVVSGSTVVVGGTALSALDTATGATRWSYSAEGIYGFEAPTIVDNVVYAWRRGFGLVALNLATGNRLWSAVLSGGNLFGKAPIVTADAVYVIGDSNPSPLGMVWKLNRSTGAIIWSRVLLLSAPAGTLAGETLIIPTPSRIFGLEAGTGATRWEATSYIDPGMVAAQGETIWAVFQDGIGSSRLARFAATTGPGHSLAHPQIPGRARGVHPVLAGDQFIYPSEDGVIHVLSTSTLNEIARYETLNPWAPELAVADGKLLAWNFLGQRLYTFGTSGSGGSSGREPIVFVPGITTSWHDQVLSSPPDLNNTPQNGWRILRLVRLFAYRSFFSALEQAGLREGQDYFVANYDWRLPMADAAQYYLEEFIDEAKRVSGKPKVDIVAHSYGGLVARAYIQSNRYRNDVDQLILIGTPNNGSAKAYTVWQGGELPHDTWQFLNIYLWGRSFDQLISKFDYIRLYVRSVKDLLPTVNHVFELSRSMEVPWIQMIEKNLNLAILNNNRHLLLSRARVVTGIGQSQGRETIEMINVPFHRYANAGLRWPDGQPDANNQVRTTREGDGTVLLSSARLDGTRQLPVTSGDHAYLMGHFANQIMGELGYSTSVSSIPTSSRFLYFAFASPLTVKVTDPIGRTIDTASAQSTVPNSDFIQLDWMKLIAIGEPIPGQYLVELRGTGSGEYHGLVSFSDESRQLLLEKEIAPGFIRTGQSLTYTTHAPSQAESVVTIAPADSMSPTTVASLTGTAGDSGWFRSPVTVSLSATDNTGVWKTEYRLPNQNWQAYSSAFTINSQGLTRIEYRSTDQVGNVEPTKSVEIKIDTVPPQLSFSPPLLQTYLHNDAIKPLVAASDSTSGVASTNTFLDGNPLAGSIDLFFLKLGDHELKAKATDNAGNLAEIKHSFHVGATIASTISDLDRIWQLGWITKRSDYRELRKSLERAQFFQNMTILPPQVRQKLVKKFLNEFMEDLADLREDMLEKKKPPLTQQAHQILYDDGSYLLSLPVQPR